MSYYSDSKWDFSAMSGKPLVLNFGDGALRKDRHPISSENAADLRILTSWLHLGPRGVRELSTLKAKFKLVRPIFLHCTAEGIDARSLWRYPLVIESLSSKLSNSRFEELTHLLHLIYEQRQHLGFFILDPSGIKRLSSCVRNHEERQTPYIPPRMWLHVMDRCREFLDDYVSNLDPIERFFDYCLQRYETRAGSLSAACTGDYDKRDRPFGPYDPDGRFSDVASRFGINKLLDKWIGPREHTLGSEGVGIRALSNFFSMTGYVGMLYVVATSLMRIEEAWKLRADCLKIREDPEFGEIFLLQGQTTKTVNDAAALWVVPQAISIAIEAMTSVARMRMRAAAANPTVPVTDEYMRNPQLVPRPYEPWTNRKGLRTELHILKTALSLDQVVLNYPKFLDPCVMTIRRGDLDVARRVNPTLDDNRFSIGSQWTLAWHQFRRTGAVNMFASGIVSDASLAHQLKHCTLQMTHYYAQGFSQIALDEKTRSEIVKAMHETAAREAAGLLDSNFVSPHDFDGVHPALLPVAEADLPKLQKLAKKGELPWRVTPFGGCTKNGPCEFGGFDNIIRCGGGDGKPPCANGIYDRSKEPAIARFAGRIDARLLEVSDIDSLDWHRKTRAALTNILATFNRSPQNEPS